MDKLPRIATMPIALVQRETIGWSFVVYQASAAGWAEVAPPTPFASYHEAMRAQVEWAALKVAACAAILDPPGWRPIEFKAFSQ